MATTTASRRVTTPAPPAHPKTVTPRTTLTFAVELVTPEQAEAWLATQAPNRIPKRRFIQALARTILDGKWDPDNAETIKFDTQGRLIDGQNRLQAIASSGVPCYVAIARNVPDESQNTIDGGTRRSFGDTLQISGVDRGTDVASVTGILYRVENGTLVASHGSNLIPDRQALLEFFDAHPGIADAVEATRGISRLRLLPPSVAGATYYRFNEISSMDCEVFFDKLEKATNLPEGDAILILRRMLEADQRRPQHARVTAAHKYAWTVKAWNAMREGRPLKTITWRAAATAALGVEPIPNPV